MKLKKKFKPELICSKDYARRTICDAELRKLNGKNVVCATDGRKLVVIPVEHAEESELGRIPKAAFAFARKANASPRTDSIFMDLNGKVEFANGWTMPLIRDETIYPDITKVIPGKGTTRTALNAKFLYELAQAMGTDCISIEFGVDVKGLPTAIMVRPAEGGEGEFGVLMPIRHSLP